MKDYKGSMQRFKDELHAAGINDSDFDIEDYAGLTLKELENLVKFEIYKRKGKESK